MKEIVAIYLRFRGFFAVVGVFSINILGSGVLLVVYVFTSSPRYVFTHTINNICM